MVIILLITMFKDNKEPHIQKEITFLLTVLAIGNKKGHSHSWEMAQTYIRRGLCLRTEQRNAHWRAHTALHLTP